MERPGERGPLVARVARSIRDKKGSRPMDIKKACVIGMGAMGRRIGIACARAGFEVVMVETLADKAQQS